MSQFRKKRDRNAKQFSLIKGANTRLRKWIVQNSILMLVFYCSKAIAAITVYITSKLSKWQVVFYNRFDCINENKLACLECHYNNITLTSFLISLNSLPFVLKFCLKICLSFDAHRTDPENAQSNMSETV